MDLIAELICHVKVIWISWNWKVSTFLYQSALKVCRTLTPNDPQSRFFPTFHWGHLVTLVFSDAPCGLGPLGSLPFVWLNALQPQWMFFPHSFHSFHSSSLRFISSSHHSAFNWYHFQYLGSLSSYQGWDDWRQSFKGLQIFHPNVCKVSGLWPDCLRHRSARCNWPNSCHSLSRFSFGQHFGVGLFHVKTRRETNETGNLRQHWDDFWILLGNDSWLARLIASGSTTGQRNGPRGHQVLRWAAER